MIDFSLSQIQNGEIHVKQHIPAAEVMKAFPPRVDFTKEAM